MGTITAANMKMYQCTTWAEGTTHGGDISATEIASSGDQIIFDDITDAQRIAGVTEYRKVYFKNINADSINIKAWINTAYTAANEVISIALAQSTSDLQSAASGYTYYTPTAITDGTVLDCGALAQNAYKGVWIKRVVSAGGNGYAVDTMALGFGMYS
jgi:hypothetical protein